MTVNHFWNRVILNSVTWSNKFQIIRSILNAFNDRLFEREYIKISCWVPNSNINQTKQRSTSTTRLLITLPCSLECFIKNTKEQTSTYVTYINDFTSSFHIMRVLFCLFFFSILKHRHPFHFIATPSMKLRICPWTLKNYEFATGLKISYLYSNLTK